MIPPAVGYCLVIVAALGWGTAYLPAKKVDTKDGVSFALGMAVSIFLVGAVIFASFGAKPVEAPLWSCVGGMFWATGNVITPVVIQLVGMAVAPAVWSGVNMVGGWAAVLIGTDVLLGPAGAGRVTFEGRQLVFNIVGGVLCFASTMLFSMVRPKAAEAAAPEATAVAAHSSSVEMFNSAEAVAPDAAGLAVDRSSVDSIEKLPKPWQARQPLFPSADPSIESGEGPAATVATAAAPDGGSMRRIIGLLMAVFCGLMFSINMNPTMAMIQRAKTRREMSGKEPGADEHMPNYIFYHFTGIIVAKTVFFLVYAAVRRGKMYLQPSVFMAGIGGGFLWALAQSSAMIANQALSQAVAYPITASLPGMVNCCVAMLLFREISGTRNFILLGVASLANVAGAISVSLSTLGPPGGAKLAAELIASTAANETT